jgi:hypothetical protein
MVWVSAMMVVLLGMGALVIDVGQLYSERRELQNGADAAALAVAQDCAGGDCLDETTTADHYADENANDDASNIDRVCGSGPGLTPCPSPPPGTDGVTGWVAVSTSTDNPANPSNADEVDFVLAPILGDEGGTVHATAVAAWGPVGRATTIPLILSKCEFQDELGGVIEEGTLPAGTNYVYFHDTTDAGTCPAGPSGADDPISGGFGWLANSECEVTVSADGWVEDKTGNGVPNGCETSDWRNTEVLIPIYDGTNGLTGSNGEYHVAWFAGFRILGYRFPGNEWDNGFPCGDKPKGGTTYLCGEFTTITTTGEIGSGPDYGARVVQMIG